MYIMNEFEKNVFEIPYKQGYRTLHVLTGYIGANFVKEILETYPDLVLDIVVGMTSHEGISRWQHIQCQQICQLFAGRAYISYQIERPGNHRKVYWWESEGSLPQKVFVGSANFSANAFKEQRELLVEATEENIEEVFEDLSTILCTEVQVEKKINIFDVDVTNYQIMKDDGEIEQKKVVNINGQHFTDYVELPLTGRGGEVQAKAGLNWGQRAGRDPNQAYIAVSGKIHENNPTFFPPLAEPFCMITDDNRVLDCVMAQANRKGLHTKVNRDLGVYFRSRLGVASGNMVVKEDLVKYGRQSVTIFKLEEDLYYMDFSNSSAGTII